MLLDHGADPKIGPYDLADEIWNWSLVNGVRACPTEIVQILLSKGMDPNAPGRRGETPLVEAAGWSSAATVKALLDAGANPNAPNAAGEIPLVAAVKNPGFDNIAKVKVLLAAGADARVAQRDGITALKAIQHSVGLPDLWKFELVRLLTQSCNAKGPRVR